MVLYRCGTEVVAVSPWRWLEHFDESALKLATNEQIERSQAGVAIPPVASLDKVESIA